MHQSITLKLPKYLAKHRPNNPHDVSIDIEIVETIKYLWSHKIETLNSCQGNEGENPSIVIADEYKKSDYIKIRKLIKEVDSREWDFWQWKWKIIKIESIQDAINTIR